MGTLPVRSPELSRVQLQVPYPSPEGGAGAGRGVVGGRGRLPGTGRAEGPGDGAGGGVDGEAAGQPISGKGTHAQPNCESLSLADAILPRKESASWETCRHITPESFEPGQTG